MTSTMKKVLVIEDEKDILELILSIFDGLGNYQVLSAIDGEEAIKLARMDRPDIILLDIQLPKINGYEVCKYIKSDPTMSQIKILMLSGMTQNSDRQKAKEANADGYINKPFSSIELLEKVESLLRGN
jgi:two-component system alkaline phosphatase synthesis response regulator PhoP